MTKWKEILGNSYDISLVKDFVNKKISGDTLERDFSFSPCAGEVRKFVRHRGAKEARWTAKKALNRRGLI